MNGNCSSSPKEASTTGRPDSDRLDGKSPCRILTHGGRPTSPDEPWPAGGREPGVRDSGGLLKVDPDHGYWRDRLRPMAGVRLVE